MIEVVNDLPDNVLGVRASGEITSDDYTHSLVPALEAKLARFKEARLLYVVDDEFEGYSGGAAWEDTKVGMKHFTSFERVAIVTDIGWTTSGSSASRSSPRIELFPRCPGSHPGSSTRT